MNSKRKNHAPRIGFLYNHDELHQVVHTAPIISALQKRAVTARVEVITSNREQAKEVRRFLVPDLPEPEFHRILASRNSEIAQKAMGNLVPLSRISSLLSNTGLLGQFDALIVPETTSTMLKTRGGLAETKLIFFPHGAGDRSIGFSPNMRHFDYMLLPGVKTRDRMLDAGVIQPDNHRIVGYPKFEAFDGGPPQKLFQNDKPVVLYNPHFDPRLSSWFRFGEQLLDFFANQTAYNLVVAPHVMLFQRRILASAEHRIVRWRRDIPDRFLNADNIIVDTGSMRSIDMTYTRAADIYLGDVSSQIYEFIQEPRPALFLNSHGADWRGDPNYECWNFGPVLDDISGLKAVLGDLSPLPEPFRQAQKQSFAQSFDLRPEEPSAQRAAQAIIDFLEL